MEFVKREKKVERKEEIDIAQRLLNWPECYYLESNPDLRKQLLDAADAQGLTPEDNAFRRKLYALRYSEKKGPEGQPVDLFLKSWMDLRFLGESGGGIFSGRNGKKFEKVMESIGFGIAEDRSKQNILYQEIKHLGLLYISLCRGDKNFNALIFGFGTISEDRQARKIAAEFRKIARDVPAKFGKAEEYGLFTRALEEAYLDMFPDYESVFGS